MLKHWLPELEGGPGVLNQRLFDSERLKAFARGFHAPADSQEVSALEQEQGSALTREQEVSFFASLGCRVVQRDEAYLLHADEDVAAAAVFCAADKPIGALSDRFEGQAPLAYALSAAKETRASWVVVVRGPEVRLYPVSGEAGVGGGSREATFAAINLSLLGSERDKYAHMLFSAEAFREGGHLEQLLDSSRDFVAELGSRLRERIYDETVPLIASAVARRLPTDTDTISDADLDDAFEQVMLVLFRLLFVAYGEHKGTASPRRQPPLPAELSLAYHAGHPHRSRLQHRQALRRGVDWILGSRESTLVRGVVGQLGMGCARLQRGPVLRRCWCQSSRSAPAEHQGTLRRGVRPCP